MSDNIVVDTPEGIAMFQLLARRGAVQLECIGMRRSGRPATQICREVYGLRGKSKQGILDQMNKLVERAKAGEDPRSFVVSS